MSCFCSSVRPRCRGCGAGFVLRNHPHGDVPVGSPAVSGSGELGKSVGRFTAVILKSDGQQAHIWVYFRIVFVSTNHCAGGWDLQARSMVFKSIPCGMATEVLHSKSPFDTSFNLIFLKKKEVGTDKRGNKA